MKELEVFADSDLGVQLAEAAQYYLENAEVSAEPFSDGQVMWSVIFGFHAGAALYYSAPERWDLSGAVWTKWARSLAGYSAVTDEEAIHEALLAVGETNAPEATGGELLELLDRYGRSDVRWLPNSTFEVAAQIPAIVDAFFTVAH